jgi:hypothetical protein
LYATIFVNQIGQKGGNCSLQRHGPDLEDLLSPAPCHGRNALGCLFGEPRRTNIYNGEIVHVQYQLV